MTGILYCIENLINRKKYIGKTYSTLEERWRQHIRDAGKEKNANRPLYKAINKYGVNNFQILPLGSYERGILEEEEIKAIVKYNTYAGNNTGYNATLGGDGRKYLQLDELLIVSDYQQMQNISAVAKKYKCDAGTIKKILTSNGVEINPRPVTQRVRIKNTDFIFDSVTQTAEFLIKEGYTTVTDSETVRRSISRQLNGRRKTYLKMQFEYVSATTLLA